MTAHTPRRAWAATTIPTDIRDLIDEVCVHTGESRSDFLREAIRLKLNADVNHGLDNPDLELRVLRYLNQRN